MAMYPQAVDSSSTSETRNHPLKTSIDKLNNITSYRITPMWRSDYRFDVSTPNGYEILFMSGQLHRAGKVKDITSTNGWRNQLLIKRLWLTHHGVMFLWNKGHFRTLSHPLSIIMINRERVETIQVKLCPLTRIFPTHPWISFSTTMNSSVSLRTKVSDEGERLLYHYKR